MRGQPRIGQIGRTCLCQVAVAFDRAACLAPQVGHPARFQSALERIRGVARARAAGGQRARRMRPRPRRGYAHRREKRRPRRCRHFMRLAIGRFVFLHRLVRLRDLCFQPVEHRIVIHRPPRALVDAIARLPDLPAGCDRSLRFLERGRIRRCRPMVVRPDGTARQCGQR